MPEGKPQRKTQIPSSHGLYVTANRILDEKWQAYVQEKDEEKKLNVKASVDTKQPKSFQNPILKHKPKKEYNDKKRQEEIDLENKSLLKRLEKIESNKMPPHYKSRKMKVTRLGKKELPIATAPKDASLPSILDTSAKQRNNSKGKSELHNMPAK